VSDSIPFNRVSIAPLAYLQESWNRVRDQYWLFLGITAVGLLISGLGPLGILTGPMMCGIYLCYRAKAQGLPVRFDMLFKGFDRFVESFIASLLMMAATLVVLLPLIFMLVLLLLFSIGGLTAVRNPPEGAIVGVVLLYIGAFLVVIVISMLVGMLFTFTFPLLVDREIKGVEAVKLSMRAALANFWGLLGLGLVTICLSLVGMCFCYIGAFLVLPITFGVHWITYERVFGLNVVE
jgi:uncharacterized membrane protein